MVNDYQPVTLSTSRRFAAVELPFGIACYEAVDTIPGPPKKYRYVHRGLAGTYDQANAWLRGARPRLIRVQGVTQ